MKITIAGFAGANLAADPKLLPDAAGVDSQNQKPGRGNLRPWRQPLTVATVPTGRQTIYRFGRDVVSDANYWMSLTGVGHFVRGYDHDDTTERTYFTGSGAPKWVDNTFAIAGAPYPTATRTLGVPAPASAAVVASNNDGTSENNESRYYTYTYVNAKGDESAPAAASLELVCKTDDTVAISALAAAPGGYNIDRIRVYVTVSGQNGETEFFFLREISSGLSSTSDDLRARGEVLATDGWLPPPADLSNLTAMWNGMAAGITQGSVRVCVANSLYAWPIAHDYPPPDASAVALARVGEQSLLVLTTAKPALLSGTTPDTLDLAPLQIAEACVAPRAAVGSGAWAAWPSEDGLAYYGPGGPKIATAGLLTRDDWQALNPTTMVASIYEGAYFCCYTDGGGARRAFIIDPVNPTGIFFLSQGFDALWFDELQDALFVYDAVSGDVKKWDAGVAFMTATDRGKRFQTPPVNFQWAKVVADTYPVTLKVDAGPFTAPQLAALTATNPGVLTSNGTDLSATISVASAEPFKLPAGFTATEWQLQVETAGGAIQPPVQVATSLEEIA